MGTIKSRQLILIGAMYVLASTLISTSAQTVLYAKQHGWICYFLPVPFFLLSLWLLGKITNRHPDKDLFQIVTETFPVLGRAFVLGFLLFYFLIYVRDVRMFVDFSNVSLLPTTPLIVTASLIVMTTVWIARGGIETIARITEIYAPLLIIVILALPLFVTADIDVTALQPLFDFNIPGLMEGSWYIFSYVGEVLAVTFLLSGRTYTFKHGLIGILLGSGLMALLCFLDLLVLGPELTTKFLYPNYELIRQIRITDFLDRFDLVIVGLWAPTMLTKTSYSLYVVTLALKRLLPDLSWKLSVSPVAILGLGCSFWFFENSLQLFSFSKEWTVVAIVCQLLLPVAMYVLFRVKKPALMTGRDKLEDT